jgi:hypothetical protein
MAAAREAPIGSTDVGQIGVTRESEDGVQIHG